jgi:hypothetical protein
VIAATTYYVVITARKQAVLAPIFVLLAVVGIVYATDAGPPLAAATVPAAALVPIGAWIMRLVATAESKPFADVTLVALGSQVRRHITRGVASLVFGVGLCGVATLWARIANTHHDYASGVVVVIALMNLACVIAGVGLGALISPPLGVTAGAGALAATIIVLVSLVIRFVPPLGPVLDAYLAHRASGRIALAEAALLGLIAFSVAGFLGRRDR